MELLGATGHFCGKWKIEESVTVCLIFGRYIAKQVLKSIIKNEGVITELADGEVTTVTDESALYARIVMMINTESSVRTRTSANIAFILSFFALQIILGQRNAVISQKLIVLTHQQYLVAILLVMLAFGCLVFVGMSLPPCLTAGNLLLAVLPFPVVSETRTATRTIFSGFASLSMKPSLTFKPCTSHKQRRIAKSLSHSYSLA